MRNASTKLNRVLAKLALALMLVVFTYSNAFAYLANQSPASGNRDVSTASQGFVFYGGGYDGGDNGGLMLFDLSTFTYQTIVNNGGLLQLRSSDRDHLRTFLLNGDVIQDPTLNGTITINPSNTNVGNLYFRGVNGELSELGLGADGEFLAMNGTTGFPEWRTLVVEAGNGNVLHDADSDTSIAVEANADEDLIRFTANGVEALVIAENGVTAAAKVDANELCIAGDCRSAWPTIADPLALRAISFDAANGDTDHPIADNLKVTFSSLILAESIDNKFVKLRRTSNDSLHYNLDILSANVTVSANELTINPPGDLDFDTNYYVEVDNGIVSSALDITKEWEGLSGNGSWFFKTALAPNINDTAFSPNGSGVDSRITTLTIDFNNDISLDTSAGAGVVVVRDTAEAQAAIVSYAANDSNLSASGNRLTITLPTPSGNSDDLEFGTAYYVQIAANFIENANKAGDFFTEFNNTSSWNFSVENSPAFNLGSFSFTPGDDGTANRTNNLRLTSNIPVVINGGVANAIQIFNSDNNSLVASLSSDQISLNGNERTLNMGAFGSGPLPKLIYENGYYIHVGANWIMNKEVDGDIYGGFSNNSTWNFTAENIPSITPVQEVLSFNITDPAVQPADLEGSIDLKDFSGYETNVTKVSMIHSSIGAFVERTLVEALVSINNEGKATAITYYDEANIQQTQNFVMSGGGADYPDFDANRWFEIPSREYEFTIRDVAGEQKLILRSLPNGIGQYGSHSVDVRYTND